MAGQNSKCPEEFDIFLIMREMHWDYNTYLQQPDEFLILVKEFIRLLNKK